VRPGWAKARREEFNVRDLVCPVVKGTVKNEGGDVVVLAAAKQAFRQVCLHVEREMPNLRVGKEGFPSAPTRQRHARSPDEILSKVVYRGRRILVEMIA
jgi:hypothetical protein